jgi:hypothetical protein
MAAAARCSTSARSGDALDLMATVASAGEALCQFVLNRALMNPHELAAAKTGIAECWLAVSDMLAKLDTRAQRGCMAGLTARQRVSGLGA